MKKCVSLLLALVFMLSVFAFADGDKLQPTQNFMNALDSADIKYTYVGQDDGIDQVRVKWTDDDFDSLAMNIFFQDNGTVSYRVWNIVDFSCGVNYAYQVCNEMNNGYKYAKFYVDTTDNSITVAAELEILKDVDCSEPCLEMMRDILGVIDAVRDDLKKMK